MSIRFDRIPDNRALSERITSQISDATVSGKLKPGDRLPPERELAEQFGVSRTAVRDTIKMLSGRGVLQVRRGAGIFVATAEETAMLEHLTSVEQAITYSGRTVREEAGRKSSSPT